MENRFIELCLYHVDRLEVFNETARNEEVSVTDDLAACGDAHAYRKRDFDFPDLMLSGLGEVRNGDMLLEYEFRLVLFIVSAFRDASSVTTCSASDRLSSESPFLHTTFVSRDLDSSANPRQGPSNPRNRLSFASWNLQKDAKQFQ